MMPWGVPSFRDLAMDSLRGSSVKVGTIQRRLAWPLRKDDTQNREAFHIFWRPLYRFWDIGLLWFKVRGEMPGLSNILPSFECKG